jgi:hypothetical protein
VLPVRRLLLNQRRQAQQRAQQRVRQRGLRSRPAARLPLLQRWNAENHDGTIFSVLLT